MKLTNKKISTKATATKLASIFKSLEGEPYTTISIQPSKDAEPDAVILSYDLFKLLKGKAEVCDRLMQSPEFGELKSENKRLAKQLKILLDQLRKRMGENETLDEDAWEEIQESVIEAIEKQTSIFPEANETRDYADELERIG